MTGLDPHLTAQLHVEAACNDLGERLPFDQVMSIAWQHRRLAADVRLRQIRKAPELFSDVGVEVTFGELYGAEAWATWWSNCSFNVIGRLPSARRGTP